MKDNSISFSVLVPDGEATLISSVVNSLSLMKSIKIYVLSSHTNKFLKPSNNNSCCLKYSRFIEKYIYYPVSTDSEWVSKIDDIVDIYSIDFVIPVIDKTIKRIIYNKHLFRNKSKLCILPEISSLELARDKGLLSRHLKSNNIPSPKSEIIFISSKNYDSQLDFPLIVKPTTNTQGGLGVFLLKNRNEFIKYLESNKKYDTILLQEFVDGYDVTCNVLCEKGEILAHTMQKVAVVKGVKVTPQYEFSFFHDNDLLTIMKDLMKSLNWSGVANIDFRYDNNVDSYKVIEINPRFWFNTEASAIVGVNFPYMYCLSSMQNKIEFKAVDNIRFINMDGLLKRILYNPFFIFKINFIYNNTPIRFAIKDPLVVLCKFMWRTNNIISSKILKRKPS